MHGLLGAACFCRPQVVVRSGSDVALQCAGVPDWTVGMKMGLVHEHCDCRFIVASGDMVSLCSAMISTAAELSWERAFSFHQSGDASCFLKLISGTLPHAHLPSGGYRQG